MTKLETMQQGLRLLETVDRVPLTFTHDTCSSLAPYESLPAGITLHVQGIRFHEPESGPDQVMVYLGLPGENSDDLGLTLSELIEVTNVSELLEFQTLLAAARGVAPSP